MWPRVERVEVRFRCSEGHQFGKGAMVLNVREGPVGRLRAGGGAVAFLVELSSLYITPPLVHRWRRTARVQVSVPYLRRIKLH